MAEYSEIFTNKLDWAMPFQRTGKFPLDRSSMFSSYEDALKYAQQTGEDERKLGGTSYIGLIVVVYGAGAAYIANGQTVVPQEVAAYIITGVGEGAALQKLAQTTATGDVTADIAALQSSISALDARITTLENVEPVVDTNTTYTFSTASTTEGAILVTDSDGSSQEVVIKGYDTLKALATGRAQAYVYENKEDLTYQLDIANSEKYKKGDVIYFTLKNIPDEWVTGKLSELTDGSWYTFAELETEHPDLTPYLKTSEASVTYATKSEVALKANTTTVNEVVGTVSALTQTVADNKTELEGKISKVADDLAQVDVTSQIVTQINKLDMEAPAGNTNGSFYIKYINQVDGVVTAESAAMPDVEGIAQEKAESAQTAAEQTAAQYTDEKIGELGQAETAVQYVDAKVSDVSTELTNVASRVLILENLNLDSRVDALELTSDQHTTELNSLATRVTNTESVANDAQSRVGVAETQIAAHTQQLSDLSTQVAARVKLIQVGGVAQAMSEDGTVNIASISTDVLVTGSKTLVLDCLNASLTDNA